MHQPKLNRDTKLRTSFNITKCNPQNFEDNLPQPESGAICRLPILKHLYDRSLFYIKCTCLTIFHMSDFLPAKIKPNPAASPSRAPIESGSKTPTQSISHALKTSDDSKWRIGIQTMPTQLGPKFAGAKMFCAKDAVENAVDGEFRLKPAGV
jgi:hypothetical protein